MLPLEAAAWTNRHIAWFDSVHLMRDDRRAA
jgi:hypothetical protein